MGTDAKIQVSGMESWVQRPHWGQSCRFQTHWGLRMNRTESWFLPCIWVCVTASLGQESRGVWLENARVIPNTIPNKTVKLTPTISPLLVGVYVFANTGTAISTCHETRGQTLRKVLLQSLNRFSQSKVLVTQSCPTLSFPWTVAHQAPLSM